jgi:hypothetical protein
MLKVAGCRLVVDSVSIDAKDAPSAALIDFIT